MRGAGEREDRRLSVVRLPETANLKVTTAIHPSFEEMLLRSQVSPRLD